MDLEGLNLSEIRQKKTNTVWCYLYVECKKIQQTGGGVGNRKKKEKGEDSDTENKLVVTSEEKEGEGQYRNRGKMVIMRLYEIMYVKLENFKAQ